jgi:hypothetical protein
LTFKPEANGLDNLILLSYVEILVLQNELEVILGEILDLRIMNQVCEVCTDEAQQLGLQLPKLEMEKHIDLVSFYSSYIEILDTQ